ncbi:MAG TPA: ribonuclease HI family protein [Elusimicrobiota bacterium]|nr:ribonuclease HI family protein [Elusimicrobiota bacterium]
MALALQTFSDGGARGNPGPAAIGVVLCDERHKVVHETAECIGQATNNQAEYRAMILALTLAHERGATRLECHADSELLVFQLQGRYRIKDFHLKSLAEKVKSLASRFESIVFRQIPRESPMIARADKLLNQALNRAGATARDPLRRGPGPDELF